MLYFSADPRDGGNSGGACNTCCCQEIKLRPGETNLLTINYAPWSIPIGYPGIVATMEFEVVLNDSTCQKGVIDTFGPPNNSFYSVVTPQETAFVGTLLVSATPIANTFTFERMPFTGPHNGAAQVNEGTGAFTYTPNPGFVGYDGFIYIMTDTQGRSVKRSVRVQVGAPTSGTFPAYLTQVNPSILVSAVKIDQRYQTISFPLTMPFFCEPCFSYRLTIKQPARDCEDNIYSHFMCFDLRCKDC